MTIQFLSDCHSVNPSQGAQFLFQLNAFKRAEKVERGIFAKISLKRHLHIIKESDHCRILKISIFLPFSKCFNRGLFADLICFNKFYCLLHPEP